MPRWTSWSWRDGLNHPLHPPHQSSPARRPPWSRAHDVAPRGIGVNVVSPGVIDTPFLGGDQPALRDWVSAHVPMRRVGTSDDVAAVVRYLVLEAPEYVTGARIAVDGGAESVS